MARQRFAPRANGNDQTTMNSFAARGVLRAHGLIFTIMTYRYDDRSP